MEKIQNLKHNHPKEQQPNMPEGYEDPMIKHEIGEIPDYETGNKPLSEQPDLENSI